MGDAQDGAKGIFTRCANGGFVSPDTTEYSVILLSQFLTWIDDRHQYANSNSKYTSAGLFDVICIFCCVYLCRAVDTGTIVAVYYIVISVGDMNCMLCKKSSRLALIYLLTSVCNDNRTPLWNASLFSFKYCFHFSVLNIVISCALDPAIFLKLWSQKPESTNHE